MTQLPNSLVKIYYTCSLNVLNWPFLPDCRALLVICGSKFCSPQPEILHIWGWETAPELELYIFLVVNLTQSKSKTIITRSMCVISLIVFTDPIKDMFGHYILNGFSLHSNYIQIHNNKDYSWEYKHLSCEIVQSILFIDLFRHTYMSAIHHVSNFKLVTC